MRKDGKELKKLILETIIKEHSFIMEGIDIDSKMLTVSFNPTHEDAVDSYKNL